MTRRSARFASVVALLLLGSFVVAAPASGAAVPVGPSACRVKNLATSTIYMSNDGSALTLAIDAAGYRHTLEIRGTCHGNYFIQRDLGLKGTRGAVLDGDGVDNTIRVYDQTGVDHVTVKITNLTITDGAGTFGGGILGDNATIRLLGNTLVTGNNATLGAGVFLVVGSNLIMDNTAQVANNVAATSGGGVFVNTGSITMKGSSTVHDNTNQGVVLCTGATSTGVVDGVNVYNNTNGDVTTCT